MASRASAVTVLRFSRTERTFHWIHAAAFVGLFVTGAALYSPALAGVLGSRAAVKTAHLIIATAWLAALLLTAALGDRRRLAATRRELEVLDRDDGRWLRGGHAPQGRFNAGQKLHAVVQAACATLFVVSGVLLLAGERNTSLRLSGTIALHDTVTIVATALVLGHLYLALVHRSTRPALRGMVTGSVDARWAAEHHAKWEPGGARGRAGALVAPMTWVLLLLAAGVAVLGATQI
jgi:formate dehydrogenase subunit gamma